MEHLHRTIVRLGPRQVAVVSGLVDGSAPEVVTKLEENGMTTDQKRGPLVGPSGERRVRDEASMTRQIAAQHLTSVQELLSTPSEAPEVRTAKNPRARGAVVEPQGMLASFCLEDTASAELLADRKVSTSWLAALKDAALLAAMTSHSLNGATPEHVVVHGENLTAHLRTTGGHARACLVELASPPSEQAIAARLENLKCAP